jgi:hypothetical protein
MNGDGDREPMLRLAKKPSASSCSICKPCLSISRWTELTNNSVRIRSAEDDGAAANEQLDAAQRKKEKQETALERKRLKSAIESAAGSALQDVTPS